MCGAHGQNDCEGKRAATYSHSTGAALSSTVRRSVVQHDMQEAKNQSPLVAGSTEADDDRWLLLLKQATGEATGLCMDIVLNASKCNASSSHSSPIASRLELACSTREPFRTSFALGLKLPLPWLLGRCELPHVGCGTSGLCGSKSRTSGNISLAAEISSPISGCSGCRPNVFSRTNNVVKSSVLRSAAWCVCSSTAVKLSNPARPSASMKTRTVQSESKGNQPSIRQEHVVGRTMNFNMLMQHRQKGPLQRIERAGSSCQERESWEPQPAQRVHQPPEEEGRADGVGELCCDHRGDATHALAVPELWVELRVLD